MWYRMPGCRVAFLFVFLVAVLLPACRRQEAEDTVEGTVLDSEGKPVAEVRVFNSGDGPKSIETQTDASGRFRLSGLNSGPVYVFAEKAECRFAGVRTTAGATDVALKLLRQTESMPVRPVASKTMPLDQQRELARKMLEKLWTDHTRSNRWPLIRVMSPIDPKLALRWSAESNTDCTGFIRVGEAERIADTDLDEALSMLEPSRPERLNSLTKLAHRYTDSDPEKAMRCTEELLVGARAFDQPWRTGYLADAASLLIRLGQKDVGQKLLNEAGEMAAKLGDESTQSRVRHMVVKAMAPHDLKRAMDLLKPILADNDRDYCLDSVADAICLESPDQAMEIAAKLKEPDRIRLRIAYRLASTRPADAIRLVDTIGSDPQIKNGKMQKAVALGWVAVAMAPRDKLLACSLIDRAFALLMSPGTSESSESGDGGWRSRAALLAVQAQRIGYPDMESIVHRVLACRPTVRRQITSATDMESLDSQVFMAALLGLVDPQAARDVLDAIEPHQKAISVGVVRAIWVKAWILADPKRGQALFDKEVASMAGKPKTDLEYYELVYAAELLAAPPHKKVGCVSACVDFQCPAEE